MMSMLLTLLFTCLAFLGLAEFGVQCKARAFFPVGLSNHCQDRRGAFSEIFTKFDDVPLLDPSRNRTRQWLETARLQDPSS
jgi:hypothetical protein